MLTLELGKIDHIVIVKEIVNIMFWELVNRLSNLVQIWDSYLDSEQIANDEIMKMLQLQNKEYLEVIIDQNKEIIKLLKGLKDNECTKD